MRNPNAQTLAYIIRTSSVKSLPLQYSDTTHDQHWDIREVGSLNGTITEYGPQFDIEDFYINDLNAFKMLLKIFSYSQQEQLPLLPFLGSWKHKLGQLSLIGQYTKFYSNSSPPDTTLIVKDMDYLNGVNNTVWNSKELILKLVELCSFPSTVDEASLILDNATRAATEITLLGFVLVPKPWTPILNEGVMKLIILFLIGHPSSSFILETIFAQDRFLVLNAAAYLHSKDPMKLGRLLDVVQELKALDFFINANVFPFSLDLACLASRRDFLNLDKWLQDSITKSGDIFIRAAIEYLLTHNEFETEVSIFVPRLSSNSSLMSHETFVMYKEFLAFIAQKFPKFQSADYFPPSSEGVAPGGSVDVSYSPQIEAQANAVFEKIYTQELNLNDALQLLKNLKNSKNQMEQDTFNCMIHNLFDEYKFFFRYPEKELMMTGEFFGLLVKNQLINTVSLGMALRIILESLRHENQSKLFKFGIISLKQFTSRLHEWPQYCTHLLQIPHIEAEFSEGLSKYFQKPETTEQSAFLISSSPPTSVKDKIMFALNNLSLQNIPTRAQELKKSIVQYVSWFCSYLIDKRVSSEPNFHELYICFLEELKEKSIFSEILEKTYASISVLLKNEKTAASTQERTNLKNLGSWLGGITLKRGIPIKHIDLPLKNLLIESFHSSRLIVTIPFVCKVLEQIKESMVFRPPNPWIVGILKLLVELYMYADLKLNLKFEIEVLCKNIDVDLKDIEPGTLLQKSYAQPEEPLALMSDETGNLVIPNLASYISLKSNLQFFSQHPQLKKCVVQAADLAIREIIGPVIERSISISIVTTRELVSKDFAAEPNEQILQSAAQVMASSLAGSLALVTSKEPFRLCMTNHLKNEFLSAGLNDTYIESLLPGTVQDNIELGCLIIEKAAIERAVTEVGECMSHEYHSRRRHRERGIPWQEPLYQGKYPRNLPEILKYHSPSQVRVYEAFSNRQQEEEENSTNPFKQIMDKFTVLLRELDKIVKRKDENNSQEVFSLVRQINMAASQFFVRDELALWFSQHLVKLLFNSETKTAIEVYITLLNRICEISRRVGQELCMWLIFSPDERKKNLEVTVEIIRNGLVDVFEIDKHYAQEILLGQSSDFICQVVCRCLSTRICTSSEFFQTLKALSSEKVMLKPDVELLTSFIPPEHKLVLHPLFESWCMAHQSPITEEKEKQILSKIRDIVSDDFELCNFLRFSFESLVQIYLSFKASPVGGTGSYLTIDAFAKLFVLLHRNLPESLTLSRLSKSLSVISLVMIHEVETEELFDQKPFFRFFSELLYNLEDVEYKFQILTILSHTFHILRPSFIPGFAFSWLELISCKRFMSDLLSYPDQLGWPLFHRLIIDFLDFMIPFLRQAEMNDSVRMLYKGLLRILLVLLHDFPEYLCSYHSSFCDVIPVTCVQLRNLILSAFPRNMRLPDPFTPNLKVDLLPEVSQPPVVLGDFIQYLGEEIKSIDNYLHSRSPISFLLDLSSKLKTPNYDVKKINALVLYIGMQASEKSQSRVISNPITKSAPMDIYQHLIADFDSEGRYYLLNAIANQLRFPNSHTHYFSCVLLFIFAETTNEMVKEQITRVLLERLIVNRPHPWGLLITFIELLKNPRFNFWSHQFTRCAPEIERLFESVARSCMISAESSS